MRRPLFDRFPQLQSALPFEVLADLPTPVQALSPLSEHAWIKRDDLTHPEYGGNKIRKLEFILAEARARGKNHIITFGAIGTNHGVATAMLCRQLGLRCTVLLFDQPVSSTVRQNLLMMNHYGAQLEYCGSLGKTVLRYYCHPARISTSSYFLFAGGSNPAGTLGFVNAALELAEQIRNGECPEPEELIVPVGSSATLAGLTIGAALAGLGCRVRGVRVAPSHLGPFPACTPGTVTTLIQQTCRLLARHGVAVGMLPAPILEDSFYGEGYGVATEEGARATALLSEQGISVEQTYTAKAAAAFVQALDSGVGPVMYWHTFNSRPVPDSLNWTGVPQVLVERVTV